MNATSSKRHFFQGKSTMVLSRVFIFPAILFMAFHGNNARGQVVSVGREALESFGKYLAKSGAKGAPSTLRATETLIASHGDDALKAANAVGWKSVGEAAEAAGNQAPDVIKYMARSGKDSIHIISKPEKLAIFLKYGDEGAEALLRHKGIAETLIQAGGKPAVEALAKLSPRGGRQLAMLTEDAATASLGKDPRVLKVIAKFGDRAMQFIWDNKGALAVAGTLTAFVANPESFLNGAVELIGGIGEKTIEEGGKVLTTATGVFPWNTALLIGGGLALPFILKRLIRRKDNG